jgi:cytochrome c-type biogenesis protein
MPATRRTWRIKAGRKPVRLHIRLVAEKAMLPNAESLVGNIGALTPLGIGSVALAGLLVGIAPSSFPLISIASGFGAAASADGSDRRHRGLRLALGFVLGIVTIDTALGAVFGLAGFAVMRVIAPLLAPAFALLAALLTVIGLALLRVVRIRVPVLVPTPRMPSNFLSAYLLGLPFGLSSCPACTPLLLPVLGAASFTADPLLGAVLMFSFGVGRGVPVVVAGELTGTLRRLLRSWILVAWFERVSGVLFLLAAVYVAYQALVYAGWMS